MFPVLKSWHLLRACPIQETETTTDYPGYETEEITEPGFDSSYDEAEAEEAAPDQGKKLEGKKKSKGKKKGKSKTTK